MNQLHEYLKPTGLADALTMLRDGGGSRMALAGGTWLIGQMETGTLPAVDSVVDLSGMELTDISESADSLTFGAMCTLTDFMEHPIVRGLANGVLAQAAHYEGPVNLRNAATLGGTIARAENDSELYAALLAMDARVTHVDFDGSKSVMPLEELGDLHCIVTDITIPTDTEQGGYARIARTPSDRCIVAAIAVNHGEGSEVCVALCGVAPKPILQDAPQDPPDNIRGSAEYRSTIVDIVVARALSELEKAERHAA